jgi:hypothetical protein
MSVHTRNLRDNTAHFLANLNHRAICIDENPGFNALPTVYGTSKAARDANTESLQVRAPDRICWAHFELRNDPDRFKVHIDHAPQNDYEPCYWLPWSPDKTIRITLKVSRKLTDQTGERKNAYLQRGDLAQATKDHARQKLQVLNQAVLDGGAMLNPRLFLTSMVTGCSVHIEGPPDAPTVYHGNATRAGGTLATLTTRKGYATTANRIRDLLEKEYKHFSRNSPKGNVTQGTGLSMVDYDFQYWQNPTLAQKWNYGMPVLNHIGIPVPTTAGNEHHVIKMEGAIFGVKDAGTGHWTFYFQQIYSYREFAYVHGAWQAALAANPKPRKCGSVPQEFWPGGGAGRVIHL